MPHPEAIFMGFRGPEARLNLHGCRQTGPDPFLRLLVGVALGPDVERTEYDIGWLPLCR